MYIVDLVDLKNKVGFSLINGGRYLSAVEKENRDQLDGVYVPRVLEVVLNCLNDKTYKIPADSLDVYIRTNYGDDPDIWFMAEVIEQLATEIKHKFYVNNGFDPRLYYKLQKLGNDRYPIYRFVMDLDYTLSKLADEKPVEESDITQEVSDNPSLEELNGLMARICY